MGGGGSKPKRTAMPKKIAPPVVAPIAVEDKRSMAQSSGEEQRKRAVLSSRGRASTGASLTAGQSGGSRKLLG